MAGLAFNEMVRTGELKAPIVIGRDHLDTGSVASPNRETEAMLDGSDAVSDWPLLNALLNTAGGATWVSFHHGGGVGMGFSQHAGVVIVCDGTDAAAKRIERVLFNDPATGVMRHADAGYDLAVETARRNHLKLPLLRNLGVQRQLLHPPIGQFAGVEHVRIAAIDFVHRAELLRQFARRAELAENLPVQLHLVNLAVVHGIGRIGIRAVQDTGERRAKCRLPTARLRR